MKGFPRTGISAFGRSALRSRMRVPSPPARITHCIATPEREPSSRRNSISAVQPNNHILGPYGEVPLVHDQFDGLLRSCIVAAPDVSSWKDFRRWGTVKNVAAKRSFPEFQVLMSK